MVGLLAVTEVPRATASLLGGLALAFLAGNVLVLPIASPSTSAATNLLDYLQLLTIDKLGGSRRGIVRVLSTRTNSPVSVDTAAHVLARGGLSTRLRAKRAKALLVLLAVRTAVSSTSRAGVVHNATLMAH